MGYSRRTSHYLERITLSDLSHMMNMIDLVTIGIETLRIDIGCSLEKEFIEVIHMNPSMALNLIVNQVYSCHSCICGPLN